MSVKEDICKTAAPYNGDNDEEDHNNEKDNNDERDNKKCTCNDNKYSNDNKDNEDYKNKRLKVHGIPVNPHPSVDYTLCDEYIPATAETPGFLRFKDMWLEEVPTIVINKTTGETYRTCEPYKNCKTGIITVHNEYNDPTECPPIRRRRNSVAPLKKKKVVKKQTRNPFKKFKRM